MQSLYNATVWTVILRSPASSPPSPPQETKVEESNKVQEDREEENEESKARLKLAIVFAMIGVACLTGAPLGGKILESSDKGGNWVPAQLFAGSSVAVGGMLLVGARCVREGWGSGRI